MNYRENLKTAAGRINALGGTTIVIHGFHFADDHEVKALTAHSIVVEKKSNPGDRMTVPLHWFNGSFLSQLWFHFVSECNKQLTVAAFEKVFDDLLEAPKVRFWQPQMLDTNETPAEIPSFGVFESLEDLHFFMEDAGYTKDEYCVKSYLQGEIEDPSIFSRTKHLKETRTRLVEKDCGCVAYDGEEIVGYKLGHSENGMCFKDKSAKPDEICYIPEAYCNEKDENGIIPVDVVKSRAGYTFNDICKLVREHENDRKGLNIAEDEIKKIAENVLATCDW